MTLARMLGYGAPMIETTPRQQKLPRTLGLWSGVALVVGITIGSGIFRSPAGIAQKVPSPTLMLGLWIAGGLITLCGALSLAELAAALPETGGFYAYLREGWGRRTAFLFGWAELVLIRASALGGYDYLIPKDAKQVDGAFRFIEYMSRPAILHDAWKTGRLAPRTDVVVQNPDWAQAYSIYHEQLKSARARGPHPEWPQISLPIQLAIQEALTGAKPADAALKDAARKVAPILAKTPL